MSEMGHGKNLDGMLQVLDKYWYIFGIVFILVYNIPYFILGENAVYRTHDFLEQDFVYMGIAARYLFNPFQATVPELLGGTPIASIQLPSLFQVLLYKCFPGIGFLLINQISLSMLGFFGFYLLANYLLPQRYVLLKFMTAYTFALIPCITGGASVMGAPFFIYALLKIKDGDWHWRYGCILCLAYGLGTSLVLCGFGYLLILAILGMYSLIACRGRFILPICISTLSMLAGHIINSRHSIFFGGFESHRLSWVLTPRNNSLLHVFLSYLYHGNGEYPDRHIYMLGVFLLAAGLVVYFYYCNKKINLPKITWWLLGGIVAIGCFCVIFTSVEWVLAFRKTIGAVGTVQWDRISYFLPTLWYVLFLVVAAWVLDQRKVVPAAVEKLIVAIVGITLIITPAALVRHTPAYAYNIRYELLGIGEPEFKQLTYAEFFDDKLWQEVRNAIGRPQSQYKVACLGIDPGIPLYEGFFCLDGYSVNYPLKYKEAWARIIQPELDKNDKHKAYFEDWGSRCYLVSHELPFRNEFIPAGKTVDLDININAFRDLGGEYIFSAVEIENATNLGLILLKELYSEDKMRCVYVYQVK